MTMARRADKQQACLWDQKVSRAYFMQRAVWPVIGIDPESKGSIACQPMR
jgi:hypothetical protein